jgi:ubiquinone/menaquinone biosynthesis C-methylase UbiE
MTYDVKKLYTEKIDAYLSFNSFFRYAEGLQAFFESSGLLRPRLRVLDAGCGTGVVTFALLKALRRRNLDYRVIHGFDFTPAMLARFEEKLQEHNISDVHFREANVLEPEDLPSSWTDYDLIVSSGMLEYVPKADFITSLAALRARLARQGCLLIFITRKNWITKPLIEWWWKANRYTREELREAFAAAGFGDVTFRRFPYSYFWHNHSGYIVEGTI